MYTREDEPIEVNTVNTVNTVSTVIGSPPVQLIEKAQNFCEDDDLLSPFDTGEVERQIKRVWWKTFAIFAFFLCTIGAIIFIIIRDNNNSNNNNNTKNNNEIITQSQSKVFGSMVSSVSGLGARASIHKFYDTPQSYCANSIINTMITYGDLQSDRFTMSDIDNGYFHVLDKFENYEMRSQLTIREHLTKISKLGFFENKLNRQFPITSFQINAKSDAMIFVTTINWESVYGNKLPYVTQKVITMPYDYKSCKVSSIFPTSFEECFNGNCQEKQEKDSVVFEFLGDLVVAKGDVLALQASNDIN